MNLSKPIMIVKNLLKILKVISAKYERNCF